MKTDERLKQNLKGWGIYSLFFFWVLFIGFNWKVSISISLVIGMFMQILNDIRQLLLQIKNQK